MRGLLFLSKIHFQWKKKRQQFSLLPHDLSDRRGDEQRQEEEMLCHRTLVKRLVLALPDTVPVIEDGVGLVVRGLPVLLFDQGVRHGRSP